jgi:CheY-like chemotaxis protein
MAISLLVVDDIEDNRVALKMRLALAGYDDVAEAANGREALETLRAGDFDLMLLDVMIPEMDGFQVLEEMKSDTELREIPVIMVSALDDIESLIRCIELGAVDYLTKPFNAALLNASSSRRRRPSIFGPSRKRRRGPRSCSRRSCRGRSRESSRAIRSCRRSGMTTSACCSATSSALPNTRKRMRRRLSSTSSSR